MANVITELLDRREILEYLTGIADVEAEWDLYEIDTDVEGWIGTGDNGILIKGLDSKRCLVKYELWDGPPPPLHSWDRTWSGSVRLHSGKVFTVSDYSGDSSYGAEFDLGKQDSVWQVRIHRKSLSHEEFTAKLISFTLLKIQFWSG
ncbi:MULTISPECIES: hypothetical protein [unclassified Nonomuraea]|uniref:hypothetical protein n=1 Tax=unclassified Nonomuraea TaxID=2593643 RepID=UPI0033CD185E